MENNKVKNTLNEAAVCVTFENYIKDHPIIKQIFQEFTTVKDDLMIRYDHSSTTANEQKSLSSFAPPLKKRKLSGMAEIIPIINDIPFEGAQFIPDDDNSWDHSNSSRTLEDYDKLYINACEIHEIKDFKTSHDFFPSCNDASFTVSDAMFYMLYQTFRMPVPNIQKYITIKNGSFVCKNKVCKKQFDDIYNAEDHIMLVHLNSRYKCPICKEELSTKMEFKDHINEKHHVKIK